ncbi:hypothetical protein NQ117_16640 [Paenibacillus sp. SC116]|uniref:hypothetical protein n=1 Tax=Paenibacillus sp. SC116 TaxID=2968986 RepID=UPI00215A3B8E|nr:hypothetical protein [Paenibacillus sp. SC116]MCR8845312.1 hypothetical protein [Paenibacillus sp. SC116]
MAFTKEYAKKVILSLDEVRKAKQAQTAMYEHGFKKPNGDKLAQLVGASATILGLVFIASTSVGVAAGIAGILALLAPNEKAALESMINTGYKELDKIETFLETNTKYSHVEVNLPFIEYERQGIRFVTGKGVVTRVKAKNGGWVIM